MKKMNLFYLIITILGVFVVTAIWLGNIEVVKDIVKEDGLIEYLSALFYLFGFIACFLAIKQRKYLLFSYLWLFLCFIFLGEETSWFQRIIGYSVPSVEGINRQGEFNIHNLEAVVSKTGFLDEQGNFHFDLRHLFGSTFLYRLGFFTYFLFIPLLFINKKIRAFFVRIGFPIPPIAFYISLWIIVPLSFICAKFSAHATKCALAETREMFYALFIFLYAVMIIKDPGKSAPNVSDKEIEAKEESKS